MQYEFIIIFTFSRVLVHADFAKKKNWLTPIGLKFYKSIENTLVTNTRLFAMTLVLSKF